MRIRVLAIILGVIVAVTTVAASDARAARVSAKLERVMATTDAAIPVWVFLADKEVTTRSLREIESGLTPHARTRRARNRAAGNLVDAYDVPVKQAHVDMLRDTGVHVRHVSRWLNAASVDATPEQIRALAQLPVVSAIEVVHSGRSPEPVIESAPPPRDALRAPSQKTSLDYGSSLNQNTLINIPAMHDLGYHGEGVLIAMFDTGFNNLTHPAFSGLDVMVTHDFVNGDSVVSDEIGQMGSGLHGALVLGTIAANAPGQIIGPAFEATYILAKTENTSWERHIEEDAWVAAAEWVDSLGADIISSSLTYLDGFTNNETGYTWQQMDGETAFITIGADIAASRGILIINAAGNDGFTSEPANTLGAPADGDLVLTVGATDQFGSRAGFSSVGNAADGRTKPDIMAMGLSVFTVSGTDDNYVTTSGTSLSCPIAAGAAALVLQARPLASNVMIMNAIRQTASQSGTPDRFYGWGVMNALAAKNAIATAVAPSPPLAGSLVVYPNPFNPATTIEYELPARARVTMAVYDAAGHRVATLFDEMQGAGHHRTSWDATNHAGERLASGVYLLSLTGTGVNTSRKIVLLK